MISLPNYGLNNIIGKQDEVLKNWKFNVGFFDHPCKIKWKSWFVVFRNITLHIKTKSKMLYINNYWSFIVSEHSDVPDAQPTIPLVLTYHPTNVSIKTIMTRNFHLLWDDPDTRDIYEPVRVLCACRRDTNLRDSLVRSHLNNITASDKNRGTFPCGRSQCNTCTHTNASPRINMPGGYVTINSKYSFISYNVPYAIKCHTCNKIYIGQTGRCLADRFREHLLFTLQTNTDLPVDHHFTSPRHACTDMLVSVIRS